MPRLRYVVELETSETIYDRVGHPVAVRPERLETVLTSWERVLEYLRDKQAESEVCSVSIRPI